jgi:hypothetical protein
VPISSSLTSIPIATPTTVGTTSALSGVPAEQQTAQQVSSGLGYAPMGQRAGTREMVDESGRRVLVEQYEATPVIQVSVWEHNTCCTKQPPIPVQCHLTFVHNQEKITPKEIREIQPIIYREIEVVEIRKIIQPIYESYEQPLKLEEITLPAEHREAAAYVCSIHKTVHIMMFTFFRF